LDIPNFNLLCERVPYVRDDPRQNRVGNVLGTETRVNDTLTVNTAIPSSTMDDRIKRNVKENSFTLSTIEGKAKKCV